MIDVRKATLAGAVGVAVRGDVDIATAPLLQDALDDAVRASRGPFVLDLTGVEFLDSSGINVLLRVRALLGREERPAGAKAMNVVLRGEGGAVSLLVRESGGSVRDAWANCAQQPGAELRDAAGAIEKCGIRSAVERANTAGPGVCG